MNIEALRFALAEYERMLGDIPAKSDNTHDRFARRVYESLIEDARKRLACLGWSDMGQEMMGQEMMGQEMMGQEMMGQEMMGRS